MPKVSVIIPVYNVEKYLRECLDSVVKQTLDDIEIICINDGSTDKSLEILKNINKLKIQKKFLNYHIQKWLFWIYYQTIKQLKTSIRRKIR